MSAPLKHTMLAITTERHLIGKRFDKVPPHISVLPWMSILNVRGDFIRSAREICAETDEFVLTPGAPITVGAAGYEKPAQTIHSEPVQVLHQKLFKVASELGIKFSHPEYLGDEYMAHLTRHEIPSAHAASRLTVIDNIAPEGSARGVKLISENMPFRVVG